MKLLKFLFEESLRTLKKLSTLLSIAFSGNQSQVKVSQKRFGKSGKWFEVSCVWEKSGVCLFFVWDCVTVLSIDPNVLFSHITLEKWKLMGNNSRVLMGVRNAISSSLFPPNCLIVPLSHVLHMTWNLDDSSRHFEHFIL